MRIPLFLAVAQWALLLALGLLVITAYRQLGRVLGQSRPAELGPAIGSRPGQIVYQRLPGAGERPPAARTPCAAFVPGGGQAALLAFVDPTCPSCEELVTAWATARDAGELADARVLLLTSDPPDYVQISAAFRATQLELGRLLDRDDLEPYRATATPLLVALDGWRRGRERPAPPPGWPKSAPSARPACCPRRRSAAPGDDLTAGPGRAGGAARPPASQPTPAAADHGPRPRSGRPTPEGRPQLMGWTRWGAAWTPASAASPSGPPGGSAAGTRCAAPSSAARPGWPRCPWASGPPWPGRGLPLRPHPALLGLPRHRLPARLSPVQGLGHQQLLQPPGLPLRVAQRHLDRLHEHGQGLRLQGLLRLHRQERLPGLVHLPEPVHLLPLPDRRRPARRAAHRMPSHAESGREPAWPPAPSRGRDR